MGDYMKPPIRLSAIMEIPCIWIFTHDSIGVGEDGPTHQPIEHLAALRSIPGLLTFRPSDANETLEMWKYIMPLKREPVAVVLSRQNLPTIDRTKYAKASNLSKGAYILADSSSGTPELIFMATGSEVDLMLKAHEKLTEEGKQSLLPDTCRARISIEAASSLGWDKYIGLDGQHCGMDTFGASAPLASLQEEFGFTAPQIIATAKKVMKKK